MDAHAHGHGNGKDHVPHILPFSTYLATLVALLVLTAITVGVSYIDFGAANVWIALLVATIKASVVALIFMHLFFDHKFHSIILVMGLLFLGVFVTFVMFDTETRGHNNDVVKGDRPVDIKQPWAGTRSEQLIKERWGKAEKKAEAEHGAHGGHGEKKDAAPAGTTEPAHH
ncbi:Cytochrome c oxidase polypeptide IV [Minicystis rosea]|nr:Cytochrome c oxidase polypeptide IV [Minicystis rosea]